MEKEKEINAEQIADMYNQKGMSLQNIAEYFGISKSTIQRKLVKNGYIFNKTTKKYETNVSAETIDNENIVSRKTNILCETIKQENIVNRTYAISEKIDRAIKIKAAVDGKKPIDIVREALEAYVENKYYDM